MTTAHWIVFGLIALALWANRHRLLATPAAHPADAPIRVTARLTPEAGPIESPPAYSAPPVQPSLAAILALGFHQAESDGLVHLAETSAKALAEASAKAKASNPFWANLAAPPAAAAPSPQAPPVPNP